MNVKSCPICQQDVANLSKFCGVCGYSFSHYVQPKPTASQAHCAKTFGVSAILLLILGRMMFWANNSSKNNKNSVHCGDCVGCFEVCGCCCDDGKCCGGCDCGGCDCGGCDCGGN